MDQGQAHGFGRTRWWAPSPPQPSLPLRQQPRPRPDALPQASLHGCSLPRYLATGGLVAFARTLPAPSAFTAHSSLSTGEPRGRPRVPVAQMSSVRAGPPGCAHGGGSGARGARPGLRTAFARRQGRESRPAGSRREGPVTRAHACAHVCGRPPAQPWGRPSAGASQPSVPWRGAGPDGPPAGWCPEDMCDGGCSTSGSPGGPACERGGSTPISAGPPPGEAAVRNAAGLSETTVVLIFLPSAWVRSPAG